MKFLSNSLIAIATIMTAMILPLSSSAYGLSSNNNNQQQYKMSVPSMVSPSESRRAFLQHIPAAASSVAILGVATLSSPLPSYAADDSVEELPSREVVTTAFDAVRYELNDDSGGVSYMQSKIDQGDFVGLLDFTKGYDLELRKLKMKNCKKFLQDKEMKGKSTEYMNAVTFDLIGMNRSSRPGQESADMANKYLQELRDDVSKFLQLEQTIQTAD